MEMRAVHLWLTSAPSLLHTKPAAAPPCEYLTSATVFTAQINLLLDSAGSRELPSTEWLLHWAYKL